MLYSREYVDDCQALIDHAVAEHRRAREDILAILMDGDLDSRQADWVIELSVKLGQSRDQLRRARGKVAEMFQLVEAGDHA
jgi:hypothetical protein